MLSVKNSSGARKLNWVAIRRIAPIVPASSSRRSAASRSLCMNMTPSMNCTPRLRARFRDLPDLVRIDPAGFFAKDVFSRGRGGEDPLLSQSRRQGDVNRIDVAAGQELGVTAHRLRRGIVGHLGLALVDEGGRLFTGPACDRDEAGIAGVADRLPVLSGDARASENAPAAKDGVMVGNRGAPPEKVGSNTNSRKPSCHDSVSEDGPSGRGGMIFRALPAQAPDWATSARVACPSGGWDSLLPSRRPAPKTKERRFPKRRLRAHREARTPFAAIRTDTPSPILQPSRHRRGDPAAAAHPVGLETVRKDVFSPPCPARARTHDR